MGSLEEPDGLGPWGEDCEEGTAEPEVCELCGVLISDGAERYGLLPDPAAGDAGRSGRSGWCGQRLAVACSSEHLTELIHRAQQAMR
jgi:hypothetical protein